MEKLQPAFSREQLALPRAGGGAEVVVQDSSRVLRNTYWLLALSMLPTIVGAWAGMQFNFIRFFMAAPVMAPLLMFGVMLGALFAVQALRNSAWGVPALFGFTFIAGVMLTPILSVALGLKNGGQIIGLAGGMTAAIFFAMAAIATVTKKDFSFLGKFLFVGLILLVVASLVNIFLQVPAVQLTIATIGVLIFSLFILFDVSRIVNGGETNYISATLAIFLDIYNLFISLLQILMALTGQRD
jgi:FtsH-binding integral membrane protein